MGCLRFSREVAVKAFRVVALALFGMCACFASAETNAVELQISSGIYSKYLNGWSGSVVARGASLQNEAAVAWGEYYLAVWGATHLGAQEDQHRMSEADLFLGRDFELEGFGLDVSVAYYDAGPVGEGAAEDTWASIVRGYQEWEYAAVTVTPVVRLEVDLPASHESPCPGGLYLSAGVECALPFCAGVGVSSDTFFTYDNGNYDAAENVIFKQQASLDLEAGAWSFHPVSFLVTTPLQAESDRSVETCWGASAEVTF
jgi:hypothetical protein